MWDFRFNVSGFQSKRPVNNYRDECLLVTFVIQRWSYKNIFWKYAPTAQYFWKVLQPQPTTKAFFNFRRYNLRTQDFDCFAIKYFFNWNQLKSRKSRNLGKKDVLSAVSYFKNLVTALTLVTAPRIVRVIKVYSENLSILKSYQPKSCLVVR